MSDDALLLAYLAGIVDGEGTIAVHRDGANRARFVIEVKMTERIVIELLSKRFGGVIVNRKPGAEGWKPQFRWRVTAKAARSAYQELEPYLRLKRL